MKSTKSVYGFNVDIFNQKMLAGLEALGDNAKWNRPWDIIGGGYVNAETGRVYQGMNVFILAMSAYGGCRYWATGKAWNRMGYEVKQDEVRNGTLIVWAAPVTFAGVKHDKKTGEDVVVDVKKYVLKTFVVYAGLQIEGWTDPTPLPDRNNNPERLAEIYDALGVQYEWGGDSAVYYPMSDKIRMPQPAQFHNPEGLMGTGLHELMHWTGHGSRLHRSGITDPQSVKGTPQYAYEEVIAEAGSSIVAAMLGLQVEPDTNVLAYIKGHARKMVENDKWSIYKALKEAAKAAEFVLASTRVEESEEGE